MQLAGFAQHSLGNSSERAAVLAIPTIGASEDDGGVGWVVDPVGAVAGEAGVGWVVVVGVRGCGGCWLPSLGSEVCCGCCYPGVGVGDVAGGVEESAAGFFGRFVFFFFVAGGAFRVLKKRKNCVGLGWVGLGSGGLRFGFPAVVPLVVPVGHELSVGWVVGGVVAAVGALAGFALAFVFALFHDFGAAGLAAEVVVDGDAVLVFVEGAGVEEFAEVGGLVVGG